MSESVMEKKLEELVNNFITYWENPKPYEIKRLKIFIAVVIDDFISFKQNQKLGEEIYLSIVKEALEFSILKYSGPPPIKKLVQEFRNILYENHNTLDGEGVAYLKKTNKRLDEILKEYEASDFKSILEEEIKAICEMTSYSFTRNKIALIAKEIGVICCELALPISEIKEIVWHPVVEIDVDLDHDFSLEDLIRHIRNEIGDWFKRKGKEKKTIKEQKQKKSEKELFKKMAKDEAQRQEMIRKGPNDPGWSHFAL